MQPPSQRFRMLLLGGVVLVACFHLPYAVLGEACHIRVHDTLDSNFATYSAMYYPANRTRDGHLPFLLGGLPPEAVATDPELTLLCFRLLPPLYAYIVQEIIVRMVAFVGMFLLLGRMRVGQDYIAFGVALSFALLPFLMPSACLSTAGLPALVCASRYALGIGRRTARATAACLAVFALFPLCSSLAFVGVHVSLLMAGVWVWRRVRRHSWSPLWVVCGVVLGSVYFLANWGLLADMLGSDPIVWHRVERLLTRTWPELFKATVGLLLFSQYHFSANPPLIWCVGALTVAVCLRWPSAARRSPEQDDGTAGSEEAMGVRLILLLGVAIACIALFYLLYRGMLSTYGGRRVLALVPGLSGFQLDRFYVLYPLLFYVMFYVALCLLWNRGRAWRRVVVGLLIVQIGYNVATTDVVSQRQGPTYAAYVGATLFDKAETLVGAPRHTYRIACVGFFPAIAHLNGFWTVDGYWFLYPLEYQRRFREAIRHELARSPVLRDYFDHWGARCYIMSAELGKNFYIRKHEEPRSIAELRLDAEALRDLGAAYLFSAVTIENHRATGLEYVGQVTDDSAAIDLYVYRLARGVP